MPVGNATPVPVGKAIPVPVGKDPVGKTPVGARMGPLGGMYSCRFSELRQKNGIACTKDVATKMAMI